MCINWIKNISILSSVLWICSLSAAAYAQAPVPERKPEIVRPDAPKKPVPPKIDKKIDPKKEDIKPVDPKPEKMPPKVLPPKDPKDPRIEPPAPKLDHPKPAPDPAKPAPPVAPEPKLVPVPNPDAKLPLDKKHAPAPELPPKKVKKPRILTPAQKDCKIEREACKQDCKAEKKACGKMKDCANQYTLCKQECNHKLPCH